MSMGRRWLQFLALLAHTCMAMAAAPDFEPAALSAAVTAFAQRPATGHPRLLQGRADFAGIVNAAHNERLAGLKAMESYLRRIPALGKDSQPAHGATRSGDVEDLNQWFKQERALESLAELAVAWYLTRDTWYLDALKLRAPPFAMQVTNMQCNAAPMQTRAYAWYFALAYDFAYDALSPEEKKQFTNVIWLCTKASLSAIVKSVADNPHDGVAFHALGKFIGSLLVVLGDVPEAQEWLRPALQAYIANLSPWGRGDGGYANGTSYAHWDVGDSLLVWDLLDRVLGIPIYQHPWVAELPSFIVYTLPPGTATGVFGDGAEVQRTEEWARFGKALMSRYNTPLTRWYAKQIFGDDPARLNHLLSPRVPTDAAPWPTSTPGSKHFPSVGWAALHSDVADRSRISIFFKSSPFGSLNHSHADQNSFVMFAHGKVLAMDSGHYDYYNSPHWRDWYKQTRAHNAVTFDGGKGQFLGANGLGAKLYGGEITKFLTTTDFDLVSGDATAAYGGQLTSAKRTLVYLKPATLLIIDQLASAQPRHWEWNLHTTAPLSKVGQDHKLTLIEAEMCAQVSSAHALSLKTDTGYSPAPNANTPVTPHFVSQWAYTTPTHTGLFVSTLRADCAAPEGQVIFDHDETTISVGSRIVRIAAGKVTVQ